MNFNLKLIHKGLILVSVPLIFEIIFIVILFGMVQRAEVERAKAEHGRILVGEAGELLRDLYNAGAAILAYRMLRNQEYANHLDDYIQRVKVHEDTLARAALGNTRETDFIQRISACADTSLQRFTEAKQVVDEGGQEFAMRPYKNVQKESAELLRELLGLVQELTAYEASASPAPQAEHARVAVHYALLGGVVLNIMVALSLAVFFNRGTSQRLGLLMENTHLLANGEKLKLPISGGDEIAHLDKVFHDMADSLEQAAKLKREFVAMITHDLRTPLSSVLGSLSLLSGDQTGALGKEATQEVQSAKANVSRVIRLINELLDVEKMEAGKMEMELDVVPVAYVLENAVDAVRGLAEELNITLSVPSTDAQIYADGDRLAQVMVNLLSNAVKFSPRGKAVKVEVNEAASYVEFKVIDHGPGIAHAHATDIFEKYKQVKGVQGSGQKGTGLGLSISKLIVEQHGGTIGFDSREGLGSTFWFRIPNNILGAERS
jgi:signal transduction histidine kinase